jgi:hypothetical protein
MEKKALLIGINYSGTNNQLNGCIQDIYNMRDILVKIYSYPQENIRILSDKDIPPTRKNIEDNISWLVSNNKAGNSLYFHYSGHGAYIKDTSNDEGDRKDEVIVPIDFRVSGFIVDDWLFMNLVSKVQSGVRLVCCFDSCHSGTVLDLKHNYKSQCSLRKGANFIKSDMKYISSEWTDRFTYSIERSKDVSSDIICFSGAYDSQFAADTVINNIPQGAFTNCLVKFINDNTDVIKNRQVKNRNVLKEINCRLKIGKYTQCSQLSVTNQSKFEDYFYI